MKKKLGIIALSLGLLVVLLVIGRELKEEQVIFINEVRSWDADITRTGYYGSDYIELYNASSEAVSLEGWYISDDEGDLKKSRISDVIIEAKGYALIYANGSEDSGDSALFKINPEGEKIFLSNGNGKLIDSIYVPRQELGSVYARISDGDGKWVVKEPSILESNATVAILPEKTLEPPTFSHKSGFYDDEIYLSLSAKPGEKIYYTLDGSIPTEKSILYRDKILLQNKSKEPNVINEVRNIRPDWSEYVPSKEPLDKAVVVRAISMDRNNCVSEVITHTYFIDLEKYENMNVVSIVSDYEELFGDNGIFVTGKAYDDAFLSGTLDGSIIPNIHKGGRRWEALGNMQILNEGEETVNQEIGIRIQGASSRNGKKKRMSIFAREEYSGSQYIKGLGFTDGIEAHSVMNLLEKASIILQELITDRNVATQSGMENTLFINGEYYYSGYMLEKYNKYYLQDHFGVNPENVMIVKCEEVTEGPELSDKFYGQMVNYAKEHDLSVQEYYDELRTRMDMQSFIDYICANAYFCNMDVSEKKNYMVWRTIEQEETEKGDMRWRWMIYDVDCLAWTHPEAYGVEKKSQINSFSKKMEYTGESLNSHPIFAAAKANKSFCRQFVLTFMDMANVNFSKENVEKVFAQWNTNIDDYDGFFKERFDYIVPYMAEEFGLTGTLENVTLKVNDTAGGTIQLNTTMPDVSDGSWTGKYYTDYPVTVTATANDGYKFAGWSGSVTSDSATIEAEVLQGGIVLEAVFEKIAD